MFRRVLSAAIVGLEIYPVQVEVDVSDGLPCFVMVGYVSAQVREAQDRVRTALKNAGAAIPPKRITVNLAPADIRKDGAGFDLPIAAAILSAAGRIPEESLEGVFLTGELGLNGEVHAVPGILPMVLKAQETGCRLCVVPEENLAEARVIREIPSIGIRNIQELLDYLCDHKLPEERAMEMPEVQTEYNVDFSDICGQEAAKRAALIAVSGFHNLLFVGPPGTGKTMLARRIPTILPPLSRQESLEISRIYSVAGLLSKEQPLMGTRPFCAPHHTATPQSLAGGGLVPKPGLVTLSHRGAGIAYSVECILEELHIDKTEGGRRKEKISLASDLKLVYSVLSLSPKSMDQLSEELGMPIGTLAEVLLQLELEGYVQQSSRNHFIKS